MFCTTTARTEHNHGTWLRGGDPLGLRKLPATVPGVIA